MEPRGLREYIWTRAILNTKLEFSYKLYAILSTSWDDLSTDNPLQQLHKTFIFQVLEEAYDRSQFVVVLNI